MVFLQHLLGVDYILMVLRSLIPGHLQHRLNVCPDHTVLSRTVQGALETAYLLLQLLLHLVRGLQLVCSCLELLCVGDGVLLSQLLPDQFQLLPQDIFPLVLVHSLPHLCLDLFLDVHDLHLVHQLKCQQLIALQKIRLLQKLLQIFLLQRHIGGDPVHYFGQVRVLLHLLQHVLGILGQPPGVLPVDLLQSSCHGLLAYLVCRRIQRLLTGVRQHGHVCPHIGSLKLHGIDDRPLLAGDQHP